MKVVKIIIEFIKLAHKYGGIIKAVFSGIEKIKDEIEAMKLDDEEDKKEVDVVEN